MANYLLKAKFRHKQNFYKGNYIRDGSQISKDTYFTQGIC